jgi:hypothetical protein
VTAISTLNMCGSAVHEGPCSLLSPDSFLISSSRARAARMLIRLTGFRKSADPATVPFAQHVATT